ncbi:MAG: hypothetical protein JST11_02980 [Acidobacteria bacterium]|nr:hypothetical protein [Acidobacteriota bacterium]
MFDMHGTRDDSIWKNLALAFGDGLAFGVGVNLTQNAGGRSNPSRADVRTLAERLNEIEQRIEQARQNRGLPGQYNQKVIEAVVAVVDARLREQAEQFEQRLAGEMAALRAEFSEQIAAARKHAEDENHILRGQMAALHRQFAESLGRMVDEQIAATIEVRLAPVETRLREEVRQEAGRAVAVAASAAEEQVAERVQPLEGKVGDLDRRLTENDQNTLELVLALGQLCLQTAERLSAPAVEMVAAAQPPPGPPRVSREAEAKGESEAEAAAGRPVAVPAPAVAEPVEAEAEQADEPAAAVAEPAEAAAGEAAPPAPQPAASETVSSEPRKPLWRMPLVSSFFMATTGLLLLHYL